MNNQVSNESKNAAIKTLAIIGFIAVVVIGIWLAVQVVRFAPSAFSTLASIADSVYEQDQDLVVVTEKNIVNSGESFKVSWTKLRESGTYLFTYQCVDGVSAEARNANGAIVDVDCEVGLPVNGSSQTVDVIFSSEKRRFADISFAMSFVPEDDDDETLEDSALITVVNATISQSSDLAQNTDDDGEVLGENSEEEENAGGNTGGNGGGNSGVTRTVPITTTTFPVSDPNGFVDLEVTYLGIGTFNIQTEKFTPGTEIDNDKRSAIRFEVKNKGTKTSGTWDFEADLLENPGYTYKSATQAALRPNERSVLTVAWDEITEETGTMDVSVEVSGGGDTRTSNNSFTWAVKVVD